MYVYNKYMGGLKSKCVYDSSTCANVSGYSLVSEDVYSELQARAGECKKCGVPVASVFPQTSQKVVLKSNFDEKGDVYMNYAGIKFYDDSNNEVIPIGCSSTGNSRGDNWDCDKPNFNSQFNPQSNEFNVDVTYNLPIDKNIATIVVANRLSHSDRMDGRGIELIQDDVVVWSDIFVGTDGVWSFHPNAGVIESFFYRGGNGLTAQCLYILLFIGLILYISQSAKKRQPIIY